jgi:hypothetical protein
MKHWKWLAVATATLVLASLACGGGGEETPVPTDVVEQPTEEPTDEPTEEPVEAGLDYTLEPAFGTADIQSGFVPDPFEVMVMSGGGVDVAALDLGDGCLGYASSAPDYRINWSGESANLRIFFVADEETEDATLIISDPMGNWICNDDFEGWNPLVELSNPPAGQYDVWVGSYMPDVFVAGAIYVTELDIGPGDTVSGGPDDAGNEIAQWASGAVASSEYGSAGWSAIQATGAPDTPECGDIQTAWASATATGLDWLELTYDTPVVPTEINIYETHSPGFIVEVEVIDEMGDYYSIWTGDPELDAECPRIFSLTVTGVDFPVQGVRINLDQTDGNWNEIDAVELVGIVE